MIRWVLPALMLVPAPGVAAIRGLFVGIDKYRYSTTHVPEAEFNDLQGAVSDTARIKAAFADALGLDLDPGPVAGRCKGENGVSITLTDDCADRAAILAAFDRQVMVSRNGDTLVFYFAGHGSRFVDTVELRQASRYNSTILAADARKPGALEGGDILDREWRDRIDAATAHGINIVTIFDSCNSGTGTREGEGRSRGVPWLKAAQVAPLPDRPPSVAGSSGQGYRMHFAAALDTEESREVRDGGVFTTAFVETLPVLAHATFEDIATEVALKVAARGHGAQHPQAEGERNASFGGARNRTVVLRARPDGDKLVLDAGTLSGMTQGSQVAVFARRIDALDPKSTPIATGRISDVGPTNASIILDAAPVAPLPPNLSVRETQHAYGTQVIDIGVADAAFGAAVTTAIAELAFVRITDTPAYRIAAESPGSTRAVLTAADGTSRLSLGDVQDPGFGPLLRDALRKIAHAEAILALRTDPTGAEARFCIATGDYDPRDCPPPDPRRGRQIALGKRAQIAVKVPGDQARYVYIFAIDDAFAVDLALPQNGGIDPPIDRRIPPLTANVAPRTPGLYRFVTIATTDPIDAAALQQSRAGARDPAGCRSTLEQLLCAAASGSRDLATPRVGPWTASVTLVSVRPEGEIR
jgi:hypothetical protein